MDFNQELTALFNELAAYQDHQQTLGKVFSGFNYLLDSRREQFIPSDVYIKHSLQTAFELTKLGINSQYIIASLIYFPILFDPGGVEKALKIHDKKAVEGAERLFLLEKRFGRNLPWIKLVDKGLERQTNLAVTPKKRKRDKVTAERLNAFIKMAGDIETVACEIISRYALLLNIDGYEIDPELRRAIIKDSLEFYAIVAETIGLWSIKWRMEDESFKLLQPKEYHKIVKDLNEKRESREKRVKEAAETMSAYLAEKNLRADVSGRPKHIYSIHKKKLSTGIPLEHINDLIGIRVIVDHKGDCYKALNLLEREWGLMKEYYLKDTDKGFRDWIATPKDNGYQSLHTTILFKGRPLEVQIRTHVMDQIAEYGVAAHWLYKKKGKSKQITENEKEIINQLSNVRKNLERILTKRA